MNSLHKRTLTTSLGMQVLLGRGALEVGLQIWLGAHIVHAREGERRGFK